jgi:GR25 family glycosyltransferase involved in LPS biosynthesis
MEIKQIRYINIEKNIGRKYLIEKLLAKFNFPFSRVPGVTYEVGNPDFEKYVVCGLEQYVREKPYSRQKGVIGCWIAHSKALENVTEQDGITVVLEDDFVCRAHFFNKAMQMVNEFKRDFDVIMFDPFGKGPLESHKIVKNIYDPQGATFPLYHGAQCLFVNNKSIPKILDAKLTSQIRDYDGYLFYNDKNIVSYVFYTGASSAIKLGSDIEIKKFRTPFFLSAIIGKVCSSLSLLKQSFTIR